MAGGYMSDAHIAHNGQFEGACTSGQSPFVLKGESSAPKADAAPERLTPSACQAPPVPFSLLSFFPSFVAISAAAPSVGYPVVPAFIRK
jgi:hypothetical protein